MPTPRARVKATAFQDGAPIHHCRFSVVFGSERNLAIFTAHNIDGATMHPVGTLKRKNLFRFDPQVPNPIQCDDSRGYRNNPWDRGHLVRRHALHWGPLDVATTADSESFYWTNIVPQHRSLHKSAWGRIENWILALAESSSQRACVFTGPVLSVDDPVLINHGGGRPVQLPAGFWKVVAIPHQGALRIAAFLVWQRDFDRSEPVTFDPVLEQVRLTTLEFLTGLSFAGLQDADPLRPSDGPIAFGEEEEPRSRPLRISGPGDILL